MTNKQVTIVALAGLTLWGVATSHGRGPDALAIASPAYAQSPSPVSPTQAIWLFAKVFPLTGGDCEVTLYALNETPFLIDTLAGRLQVSVATTEPPQYYRFELVDPGKVAYAKIKLWAPSCQRGHVRIMTVDHCKLGHDYINNCGAIMRPAKPPADDKYTKGVEVVIDPNAFRS